LLLVKKNITLVDRNNDELGASLYDIHREGVGALGQAHMDAKSLSAISLSTVAA